MADGGRQGIGRIASLCRAAQLGCTIPESGDWVWLTSIGNCEDASEDAATDDEENSLRVFHDDVNGVVELWGIVSDRLSVEEGV